MATQKQIEGNRRNAQKSTGPVKLRRLGATEVEIYKHEQAHIDRYEKVAEPQGQIASNNYRAFESLQRRLDSTRRQRDRVRESIRRPRAEQAQGRPGAPACTPSAPSYPIDSPTLYEKLASFPNPTVAPAATRRSTLRQPGPSLLQTTPAMPDPI